MSSKKKETIIIYGSLVAAVFCLLIASLDYYHDLSDKSVKKEINKAINELKSNDEVKEEKEALDVESEELKQLDKNSLVKKYLDEIIDRAITDENLPLKMVKTWGNYEVINVTYQKKVVDNYYYYISDIKIPNLNATLPVGKNIELSTDEYIVISLKTYILKTEFNDSYILKNFEI